MNKIKTYTLKEFTFLVPGPPEMSFLPVFQMRSAKLEKKQGTSCS